MINNLKNFGTVDPELKIILGPCIESLSISGDWTNAQYVDSPVDYTGLTFTVTYNNGTTASVTPTSISPSVWGSTEGEQSCTFTYEENKFRVNASKSANVVESWTAQTITLTNPNSALAFRSISGNFYTDSACTTKATTNTQYAGTTFYYKSNETKPTGSYIYNYGDGATSDSEPSKDTITTYYDEGSLTACLGTSGYCWSGTKSSGMLPRYYMIDLSTGSWETNNDLESYYRIREASF